MPGDARQLHLQALAESSRMFAEATTDIRKLLGVVARRFSALVGEATNIRLVEGDALVPVATYHPDPKVNAYLAELHDQTPLRVGEGISGRVLETGEPYFMPELDLEVLYRQLAPRFRPIFEAIGITGMIVTRLRARGVNLGYLSLFRTSHARPPYTEDDLALVCDLADRAALAIDTSRLLDELENRVAERTISLQKSNRELEAFALSVSHDLRSPLRAIDGFSKILEEDYGERLDDEGRRVIGTIRRNTTRMGQLIEDLLALSRVGYRDIGSPREVDMRELVEEVIADIRVVRPALAIDLRLGDLPHAVGDRDLLRQVWTNLLDNAVKYSGKRPTARVEVDGARDRAEVRYTVTDHGAGFDPQYADKLFGVFQRLHDATEFEGNGVGLAIVERIVSKHAGRVWAEGRPGAGATFGFAVPAVRGIALRL